MLERIMRFIKDPDETPAGSATREPDILFTEGDLNERILAALRSVYDPEIPVNIYDLGLIYDVRPDATGHVDIDMTLTAPACPVAGQMPGMVEAAVMRAEGVKSVNVELVWDPPWTQDRMSDEARLELGMM